MTTDDLAKDLAACLARHQTRGLVDSAAGLADVVIHGRVDLLSAASDLIATSTLQSGPVNRSWASWFARGAADRRQVRRQQRKRERLIELVEAGKSEAELAMARLKLREIGEECRP